MESKHQDDVSKQYLKTSHASTGTPVQDSTAAVPPQCVFTCLTCVTAGLSVHSVTTSGCVTPPALITSAAVRVRPSSVARPSLPTSTHNSGTWMLHGRG